MPVQRVEWRILKAWKGDHRAGELLESTTMTECCACGVSVAKGEQHLFYLRDDRDFSVTTCSVGEAFRRSLAEQTRVLDEIAERNRD